MTRRGRDPGHLPRWQRRFLYAAGAALLLTGLLWLGFEFAVRVDGPFGPRPHWLQHEWLRLHGLAAIVALVAIGSLIPVHIRQGWDVGAARRAGLAMTGLLGVVALSGYFLQYYAGEATRPVAGLLHWGLGLALLPAFAWHVVAVRRRRAARQRDPQQRNLAAAGARGS